MTVERQHDHPIDGPVVTVHSRTGGPLDDGSENPAHAFGPFASEAQARAWEAAHADDCVRIILDLFDPFESRGL